MRRKWSGFTLIELLVVVAIIALLISILLPSLSRARELSKRVVCAANCRAIGNASKIYAAEPWNADQWPIPTYLRQPIGGGTVHYAETNQLWDPADPDGVVDADDPKRFEPSDNGNLGINVSTTRAFWMLIRSGETVPKTYVCPSSGDTPDDTEEIDRYYDFKGLRRVSYGYQVPFGPFDTRPSEEMDTRMALVADKGPHAEDEGPLASGLDLSTAPRQWMRFNSGNHGGRGAGEGQNVYFADGHVDFEQTPIVGVDKDNIYTLMGTNADIQARIEGFTPQTGGGNASTPNPFPGEGVFGSEVKDRATTDSLLWP